MLDILKTNKKRINESPKNRAIKYVIKLLQLKYDNYVFINQKKELFSYTKC